MAPEALAAMAAAACLRVKILHKDKLCQIFIIQGAE